MSPMDAPRARTAIGKAGNRLAYRLSEAGPDVPILFSNSLAADQSMWDAVRDRLERPTVTFDARGHGSSDVVPGAPTITDLAEDALAVMDAADVERAIVCGLSLGGITAMRLAEMAPDRVSGLVLANTAVSFPPASMWNERAEAAREGRYGDLVEPTLGRWLTERFRKASPDAAEATRAMIAAMPAEGYAAACMVLAEADLSAALRAYGGPVLVIAGAEDLSTPPARSEEMVALSGSAEMVTLEAAHLSAIEAPDAFAAHLERFASAIGGGDG